jgi:DnaJ-domain-containing protein 1
MTWILLGLIALVATLGLLRAFANAQPAQVKTFAVWGGGLLGVVLVGAFLWSGRGMQAIWSAALFGPALWRWIQGIRAARTFSRGGAASPGQASDVETSHIAMGLDHDSGRMFGRVKAGRFEGKDLAELDLPLLLDLMAELAARDPEGVPLLEAWLDRAHPDWRDQAAHAGPPPGRAPGGRMTREEALAVLGLAEGAAEAEIRAAHRRLMRTAHPDQGGSDWLAARLNEARDILLGD